MSTITQHRLDAPAPHGPRIVLSGPRRHGLAALGISALIAVACNGATSTPAPTAAVTVSAATTVAPLDSPRPTTASTPGASVEPSVGPSRAAADPCTLITKSEADTLVSSKLQDPVPAGQDGQTPVRCVWPAPLDGATAQVELDVGDGAKKFLDIERLLEHQLDPVPGLGDEAYVEDDTTFFRSGETWVALHVVGDTTTGALRTPMTTLAATILTRL